MLSRSRSVSRSVLGVAARTWGVVAFTWCHPVNRGRRPQAVARVVRFQAWGRLTGARAVVPVGSASRLWADPSVYISARAMYGNPLDWNEMQAWARVLGPGSLFVDVGANVGLYTIWAADLGAEMLAVEPDRRSLQRLEENLALNGYEVERGITPFDPAGLPIDEQVRAFAEAEVIVAVHGAALTNLVFCPPGATVVELFAPDYVNVCYWALACQVEGLDYRYLVGTGAIPRPGKEMMGVSSDVEVDLGELAGVLDEVLA